MTPMSSTHVTTRRIMDWLGRSLRTRRRVNVLETDIMEEECSRWLRDADVSSSVL